DLEATEPVGPLDLRGGGPEALQAAGRVVGSQPGGVPALGPGDGPGKGGRAVAADDDGDRLLDRPRVGVDAGEVHEAAVVGGLVVVPEGGDGVEVLVGDRSSGGEVGPEGPELRLQVAGADPEHDAAAGEDVGG